MSTSGKKVVFVFWGSMGAIALLGMVIVAVLMRQPPVQRDQRDLARLLAFAYQKYRYDEGTFPTNPVDAAVNFKSENEGLTAKVKHAEDAWGMKTRLLDISGDSPEVEVSFGKPSPMDFKFALYNKDKKK